MGAVCDTLREKVLDPPFSPVWHTQQPLAYPPTNSRPPRGTLENPTKNSTSSRKTPTSSARVSHPSVKFQFHACRITTTQFANSSIGRTREGHRDRLLSCFPDLGGYPSGAPLLGG